MMIAPIIFTTVVVGIAKMGDMKAVGRVGLKTFEGLALLIGVDRFMSESRAITNLIGNGVATMVVARWEHALDMDQVRSPVPVPVGAFPTAAHTNGRVPVGSGT